MSGDFGAWFDAAFAATPVMAILRGHDPARTVELSTRAWDLGIEHVEVPIQTPDAVPSLRAAIAAGAERGKGVGAGTVRRLTRIGTIFVVAARSERHEDEEAEKFGRGLHGGSPR